VSRVALEKYNDTSAAKMESHVFRNQAGFTMVDNLSPLAEMMRLNAVALKMTFGFGEFIQNRFFLLLIFHAGCARETPVS
jgi:hypothetical protein